MMRWLELLHSTITKRGYHRQSYDDMTITKVFGARTCGVKHNCDDLKGEEWVSWEWDSNYKVPEVH